MTQENIDTVSTSTMQVFVGQKMIAGKAMTRSEYNNYRGWNIPADEDGDEGGDDEGYLVEYLGQTNKNHPNHVGYISWSPKMEFEIAYQDTSGGMSFSNALFLLKNFQTAVTRKGWTDTKSFAYLTEIEKEFTDVFLPYFSKRDGNGVHSPWLPTLADLMANDWVVSREAEQIEAVNAK